MPEVTVDVATAIKVGWHLKECGYALADLSGKPRSYLRDDNHVGVLLTDSHAQPVKHWFGLKVDPPLRIFLGVIFFSSSNNWTMKVYGKKHFDEAEILAINLKNYFH